MKALLLTRCGCSRMIDLEGPVPQYHVMLIPHYPKGLFRDQGPSDEISTWGAVEKRTFELDRETGINAPGPVYIYREVP